MKLTLTSAPLIVASIVAVAACAGKSAPTADVRAGQSYAMAICAQCHDVTPRPLHPLVTVGGPNFADVANAKTTTQIGLNAFLMTPHPTMPNLIIPVQDRRNVIAYILSLRTPPKPGSI